MTLQIAMKEEALKKASMSLSVVNALMTNSTEMEHIALFPPSEVGARLDQLNGGRSLEEHVKTGNGWNRDSHMDGTVNFNEIQPGKENGTILPNWFDCETSTAPLFGTEYKSIREELREMFEVYEQAAGKIIHSRYASNHVHYTIKYMKDEQGRAISAIDVPSARVYRYIAKFLTRYNGTLKWLSMTNENGSRGSVGNSYDKLDNDAIYGWARLIVSGNYQTGEPTRLLESMERSSYFRIHGKSGQLHWEFRMMDCNASPSLMAAWMTLGRAITLWAIDFARNQYTFDITDGHIDTTITLMQQHRRGWKHVYTSEIEKQWREMKSYLSKYLDIMNSLEALDVLEKLIASPIPAWIEKQSEKKHFDCRSIEKAFGFRNRKKDTILQDKYLQAIRSMIIPFADTLEEFNHNVAAFLQIDYKQALSQYQMIKRDEVANLKFLGGRLVEI